MKKHCPGVCILLISTLSCFAQTKIKDGTIAGPALPVNSAILELETNNKGLLLPRVSLSSATSWGLSGTAVNGMQVYNVNTGITGSSTIPVLPGGTGAYYWNGNNWVGMAGLQATQADTIYWRLKGNTGTTPPAAVGTAAGAAHYLGTNDAKNFAIGTNGVTRLLFNQNGSLFGGVNNFDPGLNISNSLVLGNTNKDSASNTIVTGNLNTLSPGASTAIVTGLGNTLTGSAALVFGLNNKDSSSYTLTGGAQNIVTSGSQYAMVTGDRNTVTGSSTAVSGTGNIINAGRTIISGEVNRAGLSHFSAIFGSNNFDSASYTLIAGQGNRITPAMPHAAVTGKFNAPAGAALFTVGNGTGNTDRHNAITILTNGKTAVGTHTSAPHSTLTVNGSVSVPIRSVTGNTTLTDADYKVMVKASVTVTITLPDPATCAGRMYVVHNMGDDPVQFNYPISIGYRPFAFSNAPIPANTNMLLPAAASSIYNNTGVAITLQSDGTEWTGITN
jgi:hypothetical protein